MYMLILMMYQLLLELQVVVTVVYFGYSEKNKTVCDE